MRPFTPLIDGLLFFKSVYKPAISSILTEQVIIVKEGDDNTRKHKADKRISQSRKELT